LVDILLVFEVHQPYRLWRDYFWGNRAFKKLEKSELLDSYFDLAIDGDIFKRAASKCYLPSNEIILNQIDEYKHEASDFRVAYSISGVFLEQCERYNKDVLESFKQLAETGRVEFLGQTYYHSLSSLYPNPSEFTDQVKTHRATIEELLGYTPKVFENTELIYNNPIAKLVEDLGYDGIFTEGAERIIGQESPNQLFKAKDCEKLRVILRNYKLTDDVGFRFSNKSWSEYPLTAEKYADWLSQAPGQYVCIFLDYETFGEHHWPDTGIHEFLKKLPEEMLKRNLTVSTPSKVIASHKPRHTLDVPHHETVSWADIERSTHSWIGNDMQWAFYQKVRDAEDLVKELGDQEYTKIWRYLQISDHLYYMFTAGGGPGVVHSYFSPYEKPIDAFLSAQAALMDYLQRLRTETNAANEPFTFRTKEGEEGTTGIIALSMKGFLHSLGTVPTRSLQFHRDRGDFEAWVKNSLREETLAEEISKVNASSLTGEALRLQLMKTLCNHMSTLKKNREKLSQT
jgi:alpha-amylase